MSENRPYVLPTITERGTIGLLLDDQHRLDLLPGAAVEFAIQILRTYTRTYPGYLHLDDNPSMIDRFNPFAITLDVGGSLRVRIPSAKLAAKFKADTQQQIRQAIGLS